MKVLSREGCESGGSSYIRVLPPWCKVVVRNAILAKTSEINHSTVTAAITRTKIGHRNYRLLCVIDFQDYCEIVKTIKFVNAKVSFYI